MTGNVRRALRNCGPIGCLALGALRIGQQLRRFGALGRLLWLPLDVLVIRGLAGARFPASVTVGRGLCLPHDGNGVILHPATRIGDDVKIFHQVTIGTLLDDNQRAPVIGDGVVIGAGAKVLGAITVGDGARIGANAVVLQDVPAGATAVGIPARIIPGRATVTPPA